LVNECHRGGVILRGIEKQRATLFKIRQARVEGVGRQGVIGEQGADLVAFPAALDYAETAEPALAPATHGECIGLGYPPAQEACARNGEAGAVVIEQLASGQERLFYSFNLEDHVPANHLLRSIDQCLDLSDLRHYLADFYSPIGRPSIDPELMIRMLWAIATAFAQSGGYAKRPI
jgi:hypothetical protein